MSDESLHIDERALVARAAADFDAFAELYRLYLPRVHDFAYRRTGSTEAAEDICSATFEAALSTIGRFHWRSGGFAPWLFRIASRQTIAYYRREARPRSERGQLAMAQLAPSTAPGADNSLGDDDALRRALNELNDRYQQAIALRYLAHLDTAEAARAMGLTKSAFSVVLTRATKALRRQLDNSEEGETR
ncbi:MAG: sigma-70 family RNA polymerase sigma factor [Acidimicrobiales bacterium]